MATQGRVRLRYARGAALPLVTAFVLACEAPPTASLDVEASFAKGGNGQGALVTGSGHISLPDPLKDGGESLRDFTVSVVRNGSGIGGHMHLGSVSSLRPGLSFIGEVTCATIVDNGDGTRDAYIGGTNKHTNFGGNDLGAQFGVRVRDAGKKKEGTDAVSGVAFEGLTGIPNVGDWMCANTPGFRLFGIEKGNITIH